MGYFVAISFVFIAGVFIALGQLWLDHNKLEQEVLRLRGWRTNVDIKLNSDFDRLCALEQDLIILKDELEAGWIEIEVPTPKKKSRKKPKK